MSRSAIRGAAIVLGLAAAFAAPLRPAAPDRVRLAVNPYLSFGTFYLAEAAGAFSARGIDLEIVELRESVLNLPPLLTGQVDASAAVVTPGLLNVVARGAAVRVVAGREVYDPDGGCVYQGFALSPELAAAGAGRDPSKLAGRRVSVRRESLYGFMLERVLEGAGLGLDAVEIRELPAAGEIEALRLGQVDLVSTGEPWMTRALGLEGVRAAWPASQVMPGFQPGRLLFGERLLERERDLGRRFLAAYLEGVRRFREGPTEGNLDVLSGALGIDRDELRRMCWPTVEPSGEVREEWMEAYQRWLVAQGLLDRPVGREELVDPILSELAAAAGGAP